MSRDGDLRAIFRRNLPAFHWVSIETSIIEVGVPDLHYCCGGVSGWIENKKIDVGWKVANLSWDQVAWHEAYARHGGRSFVAVRRLAAGQLWLVRGVAARLLKEDMRLAAPTAWTFDRPWDWKEIAGALTA